MRINDTHHQTIWVNPNDPTIICTWDQRKFPHSIEVVELKTLDETVEAIANMTVRGAPLIGGTAAFGMYLAALHGPSENLAAYMQEAAQKLNASRPTAVNLMWATQEQLQAIEGLNEKGLIVEALFNHALQIIEDDVETCRLIGVHGLALIEEIAKTKKPGETINILTHCNAGWLATIDWGTATSPIYHAQEKGIPVHVWVDETRPRNQGAHLTTFELGQQGVPHTLITDNAGGHLMQHGQVDLVIVGTDRTTRQGDVANKIGTYLKALAANDNEIPFYVALPASTIDWDINDGVAEIPIETRSDREVNYIQGLGANGIEQVRISPEGTAAANYGFDVTPARLVTGLITERGVCEASEAGLLQLFPERG